MSIIIIGRVKITHLYLHSTLSGGIIIKLFSSTPGLQNPHCVKLQLLNLLSQDFQDLFYLLLLFPETLTSLNKVSKLSPCQSPAPILLPNFTKIQIQK